MKNIKTILFLAMLLCCISLKVFSQTSSPYKTHTKEGQIGYSISYPKNWEITENSRQNQVVFMDKNSDYNYRNNFNIVTAIKSERIDEAITPAMISRIKSMYSDYTIISRTKIKINNVDCLKIISSVTLSGCPVVQHQYVVKNGALKSYIISFSIAKEKYTPTTVKTIENIINSLKFR